MSFSTRELGRILGVSNHTAQKILNTNTNADIRRLIEHIAKGALSFTRKEVALLIGLPPHGQYRNHTLDGLIASVRVRGTMRFWLTKEQVKSWASLLEKPISDEVLDAYWKTGTDAEETVIEAKEGF